MGVISPWVSALRPRSWKLTHKPHPDVAQDEDQEEDTADDVCAAPGTRQMSELGSAGVPVWGTGMGHSWAGGGGGMMG